MQQADWLATAQRLWDILPKGGPDLRFRLPLFTVQRLTCLHISTNSLAETFDVGLDNGAQVDWNYEGSPFSFQRELDRVVITLTN